MTMLRKLLLIILILVFIDCSTLSVRTEYDPSANFSGFKTYNWMFTPQKTVNDPRVDLKLLESIVRSAVNEQLSAKGYSRLNSGSPDFLVGYYTRLEEMIIGSTMAYPSPYGQPQNLPAQRYQEGTLTLVIVEPESQKILWEGTAQDEVDFSRKPEERREKINEAVKRMLENFPPTVSK